MSIGDKLSDYRNEHDVWKKRREAILKEAKQHTTSSTELQDLGPEPEAPLLAKITMSEPTYQGLVKHLPDLRPSLGLFSDEGALFLGGYSMTAENRMNTVSGLSKFWDGAAIDRVRAGDGVGAFRGRRLSMHLMLQPTISEKLFADPLAQGQGFLARCLIARPASAAGTRTRLNHDAASKTALRRHDSRLAAMLREDLPLREGRRNELAPPLIALTREARYVLEDFYISSEKEQAEGGELDNVRPFASKAPEHAARIAAVQTLYQGDRNVSGETMANATRLATYYMTEAMRVADIATISTSSADAEQMRRWLVGKWTEELISVADAAQRGPFKETKRTNAAFDILEEHGWLLPVEGGGVVLGNRRQKAWRVVGRMQ